MIIRHKLILVLLFMGVFCLQVFAQKTWYPVEVDVWKDKLEGKNAKSKEMYIPLKSAKKKWVIKAFIPHLKDSYWLGVNHGLIEEARRLGVELRIYEAGGYDLVDVQRKQIKKSLEEDEELDGIIVGAISADGLNDIVSIAKKRDVPVIDSINGISSPDIAARVAANYFDMSFSIGKHLLEIIPDKKRVINVAWFPGPKGAGWAEAGNKGLEESLAGTNIKIISTMYGDTGINTQKRLVKQLLAEMGNSIDYIIGTTVTSLAAVKIIRQRKLAERIKVLSYYYGPEVHREIKRGNIVAASTDHTVLLARLAVDTLVRVIEKEKFFKHFAPQVQVVGQDSVRLWDSSTTLAPKGFRPIFSVNE